VARWLRQRVGDHVKQASINTYLSTISAVVEVVCGYKYVQTLMLSKYKLRGGDGDERVSTTAPANRAMVDAILDNEALSLALRVAIQFAFEGLLRVSDYAKKSGKWAEPKLMRHHIRWCTASRAFIITLPWVKGMRVGQGFDVVYVERQDDVRCPVKAMRQYLAWRDAVYGADGPLFLRDDGKPIMEYEVNRALKAYAHLINAAADDVSSHSLRSGGAFTMKEAGCDWGEIAIRGRWSSEKRKEMAKYYARFSVARAAAAGRAFQSGTAAARALPLIPQHRQRV